MTVIFDIYWFDENFFTVRKFLSYVLLSHDLWLRMAKKCQTSIRRLKSKVKTMKTSGSSTEISKQISIFTGYSVLNWTEGHMSMTNPTIAVGRTRSRSRKRYLNRLSSKMENPLWENRRLGGDLKSNYTNNLTMNNFKRPPPPSSPLQFLDLPQQPNTTYNKSDLIEKGVKQLSKDLGEFVKPYKPKFVDPNQRLVFKLTWKSRQNYYALIFQYPLSTMPRKNDRK